MLVMTDEEFEALIEQGIAAIPEKYRKRVENVAVVVEMKSKQSSSTSGSSTGEEVVYGLYEGIPLTERGEQYMFTVPDKISIFRSSILEVAQTPEEARRIVENTIWHEFGHYFGLSEEEIMAKEYAQGRDKF